MEFYKKAGSLLYVYCLAYYKNLFQTLPLNGYLVFMIFKVIKHI